MRNPHHGQYLPLIALAYASFATGLIAGFAGYSLIATVSGLVLTAFSIASRRGDRAALGLIFAGGALLALTAATPARRPLPKRDAGAAPSTHGAASASPGKPALERVRDRAARSIDELFGSDAPMARALLIADQHRIPPEMRDRYARAGMVHMLSISGLHVAIVAGAVMLLLEAVRLPRSRASLIGVGITGFYVLVIGAPAPAVRSAVMLAMVAASRLTQRPTSPWAGLAISTPAIRHESQDPVSPDQHQMLE